MNSPPSLFHRLGHTPMHDWIRGRLTSSLDWRVQLVRAQLPEPISASISEVVRRTRLWRSERVDVAREMIAHFADGLESGRSPADLMNAFGDARQAARLITRAKKRARPAWWQVQRVLGHACVALIAAYLVIAIWFFARSPDIKRNFSRELSANALSTPETDRAWPIYLRAMADWPALPPVLEGKGEEGYRGFNTVRPGQAKWADLVAHLQTLRPQLDLVRAGAGKRVLGYVMNRDEREAMEILNRRKAKQNPDAPQTPLPAREENPSTLSVLLPHLGEMRSWARHLQADTFVALEQKDSERVLANLSAMIAMSEQVRRPCLIISELVGYAMFALACETATEVMARQAAILNDTQLVQLAHRFGGFDLDASRFEEGLDGEAAGFEDVLQRLYADDGHGNGRLTSEGLRLMMQIGGGDYGQSSPALSSGEKALTAVGGPLAAMVMAPREDVRGEYLHFMNATRQFARLPLWERPHASNASIELEQKLSRSWTYRVRYLPIAVMMPALEKAAQSHQHVVLRRDAVLTVLASESFRRRTGSYPASVRELVPRDLPGIPLDRFDGQPLRVRVESGSLKVYSVGANRKDDGGTMPKGKSGDARWWQAVGGGGAEPDGDWVLFPPDMPN